MARWGGAEGWRGGVARRGGAAGWRCRFRSLVDQQVGAEEAGALACSTETTSVSLLTIVCLSIATTNDLARTAAWPPAREEARLRPARTEPERELLDTDVEREAAGDNASSSEPMEEAHEWRRDEFHPEATDVHECRLEPQPRSRAEAFRSFKEPASEPRSGEARRHEPVTEDVELRLGRLFGIAVVARVS